MGSLTYTRNWLVPIVFPWSSLFNSCALGVRRPEDQVISLDLNYAGVAAAVKNDVSRRRFTATTFLEVEAAVNDTAPSSDSGSGSMGMILRSRFPSSNLSAAIQNRVSLVSGESDMDEGVECVIHVKEEHHARVQATLGKMSGFVIEEESSPGELRQEVYRMVNNQLPFDASGGGPYAISYPRNVDQIRTLVQVAKNLQWQVYIVGAGHSENAWGFKKGMVISMLLRRVTEVENWESEAWNGPVLHMEAGAIWAEAYAAAHESGTLLMGGSCATVGSVGYYLGGGFGYLSGSLGFGADNVLRFRVVTADGQEHIADRSKNKDLFDALRGGGHLGQAVVSDVWVKLHPWEKFGCVFRVQLVYAQLPSDMSWVAKLLEKESRALHLVFRSDSTTKFTVALTYLSDSEHPTREETARLVAKLLADSDVPHPLGPTCHSVSVDGWVQCLLGEHGAPTGMAYCRPTRHEKNHSYAGYTFGSNGDMLIPDTRGGEGDSWGIADTVGDLFGRARPGLYSDAFQHRSSTKSIFFTDISQAFFQEADRLTRQAPREIAPYIATYWFGGGTWDGNQVDGSVADAFRKYALLAIISTDFTGIDEDRNALQWTTSTWDALAKLQDAVPQPHPHPNLYDRLHVHATEEKKVDGTFALGDMAAKAVEVKRSWDPDNLFHMPQGKTKAVEVTPKDLATQAQRPRASAR